jgi:hypothetical protein
MWWIILIATFLIFGIIFILYTIGKRVNQSEKDFEDMFNEHKVKQKLSKYKRKSTPKVPTKKLLNEQRRNRSI